MIQGAINQLIGFGAAAKRAGDIADAKEARAAAATERALSRARSKIQSRYDQKESYKAFLSSLKDNQAPEELKRIAFEEVQRQKSADVRIGGSRVDLSRFSPEARAFLTKGGKNG